MLWQNGKGATENPENPNGIPLLSPGLRVRELPWENRHRRLATLKGLHKNGIFALRLAVVPRGSAAKFNTAEGLCETHGQEQRPERPGSAVTALAKNISQARVGAEHVFDQPVAPPHG